MCHLAANKRTAAFSSAEETKHNSRNSREELWKISLPEETTEINKQQYFIKEVKYQKMYGVFFFEIEALLSLKNTWLPAIFFLDTKSTC